VNFATIWKRDVGDTVLGLCYLDGRRGVAVASQQTVRTYDLDGEMRWRHSLRNDFRGLAPLPNGGLVIACRDALTILNSDGDVKHETPLDTNPIRVLAGNDIVLLAGRELQTFDSEGEPIGKVELDFEAREVVRYESGFVAALEDAIGELDSGGVMEWKKVFDLGVTSLVATGNDIYLATGREVRVLDSKGGPLWMEEFPGHVKHIDVGENLLVILEDSAVFIDLETHQKTSRIDGAFSLGYLNENTAVFAWERTVDFREDVGDRDVYYEIMCRGERKCGTFVSSEFVSQCPKCGANKIIFRVEKKKLG
jgi:hypothetical protein